MAKFLDLDTVRKPVGTFKLDGVEYTVWPMKLRQIINIAAAQDGKERTFTDLLDELNETIPECPRAALEQMDIAQLNALSTWVQNGGTEDAEKNSPPPTPPAAMAGPAEIASA